jgi:hypothetical protein
VHSIQPARALAAAAPFQPAEAGPVAPGPAGRRTRRRPGLALIPRLPLIATPPPATGLLPQYLARLPGEDPRMVRSTSARFMPSYWITLGWRKSSFPAKVGMTTRPRGAVSRSPAPWQAVDGLAGLQRRQAGPPAGPGGGGVDAGTPVRLGERLPHRRDGQLQATTCAPGRPAGCRRGRSVTPSPGQQACPPPPPFGL